MKIELNITMKCNQACPLCNRMCNIYRDRDEHMTVEQIKKFVEQIGHIRGIHKVKVLGGEPYLNPNFQEIHDVLADAVEKKILKVVKVGTNKSIKLPADFKRSKFICLSGKLSRKKSHVPYLWSPLDMGFKTDEHIINKSRNCMQLRRCGYSLDKYGYLPCSMAIMIVRLFGYTHLYKHEIPTEPWGLDLICKHCTLSMDYEWIREHTKLLKNITPEDQMPTKTFKDAMEVFDVEKFYKTQKEF